MPVNLTHHKLNTPQTEYARHDQVRNTAGGVVFKIDPWGRLDRFLILGTEGGTMYAREGALTRENARNLSALIVEDDMRVLKRVKEVSTQGLAYKQDYTLFALAMLMAEGSNNVKRAVITDFPKIVRTGTHLFTFLQYVNDLRGWGRALRKAVASWYENMDADRLEYQLVKYKQRNGWSHRDALRLSHPKVSGKKNELLAWVTQGTQPGVGTTPLVSWNDNVTPRSAVEAVHVGLPREALPTESLANPDVWIAMFEKGMPTTAMIRNLGTMTKNGALKPLSNAEKIVVNRLADDEALAKARIHPIQVLAALATYAQGHGSRGGGEWTPSTKVLSSLDDAFYKTFRNVEPVGHRVLIALDVSGSMGFSEINGVPGLTPRVASAALSLVIANTEPWHHIVGFASGNRGYGRGAELTPLNLTAKDGLQDAVKKVSDIPFGGTDCALPMLYAKENQLEVDTFIVLTDNETWAGRTHPFEALGQYRRASGINAKLAVVGMTATDFSIADPKDGGMMDFVGFNPNMPQALSAFMRE